MISIGFRFGTAKKIKDLGNSNDRVDQITGRSNDNTLGIPRGKLELKQVDIMFIIISILCNDKSLNETNETNISLFVFSEHYDLSFPPY